MKKHEKLKIHSQDTTKQNSLSVRNYIPPPVNDIITTRRPVCDGIIYSYCLHVLDEVDSHSSFSRRRRKITVSSTECHRGSAENRIQHESINFAEIIIKRSVPESVLGHRAPHSTDIRKTAFSAKSKRRCKLGSTFFDPCTRARCLRWACARMHVHATKSNKCSECPQANIKYTSYSESTREPIMLTSSWQNYNF